MYTNSKMPHSHKVLLVFVIALVVSAVSAYLLLDTHWFQALLPFAIDSAAGRFGIFASFFIFVFDFLVLVIEEVRER